MSLIVDEHAYKGFIDSGCKEDTSRAFGHLFAYIQGKCSLEEFLREKFEEIGLLDPDRVTLHIKNIEDDMEWLLLAQCFEGVMKRKFEDGEFKYGLTDLGQEMGLKLMQKLVKENEKTTKGVSN